MACDIRNLRLVGLFVLAALCAAQPATAQIAGCKERFNDLRSSLSAQQRDLAQWQDGLAKIQKSLRRMRLELNETFAAGELCDSQQTDRIEAIRASLNEARQSRDLGDRLTDGGRAIEDTLTCLGALSQRVARDVDAAQTVGDTGRALRLNAMSQAIDETDRVAIVWAKAAQTARNQQTRLMQATDQMASECRDIFDEY